jgi:diphthamide synthase (EF-2-diphthine--ammonia ligase)
MDRSWLGRRLDYNAVGELVSIGRKHRISPSGEGGELSSPELASPFQKRQDTRIENEEGMTRNSWM